MTSFNPISVILCGGAGSRLWPLSRASVPKPFVPLPDGETLIEKTLRRAASVTQSDAPLLAVARDNLLYPLSEKLQSLSGHTVDILLEPAGRDTAAAMASALTYLQREGVTPEQCILFMPADHLIEPLEAFQAAVAQAVNRAQTHRTLMLFGVVPDSPHTGYGYLQLAEDGRISAFVEKPDTATAVHLMELGALWNSGMFVAPLGVFIELFEQHAPEIWAAVQRIGMRREPMGHCTCTVHAVRLDTSDYLRVPAISFDYAVVEKTKQVCALAADFQWQDVGDWGALFQLLPPEKDGSRCFVQDDQSLVQRLDSQGVSVWAGGERLVALCGVDDVVVVDMPDVVLVTRQDASAALKNLYQQLEEQRHPAVLDSPVVPRPWGHYITLFSEPGYKIKKIFVKPGHQLSYQRHRYRAEHWVVVSGEAEVVLEGIYYTLQENQSIFIPKEAKHRLRNLGDQPLEVVEVQYGSYLGEDDIERFEDDYIR